MRQYFPKSFSRDQDTRTLLLSLMDEITTLSQVVNDNALQNLEPTYVAPTKPKTGMLRYADGTRWNPGSGAGLYVYERGAWRKLNTTP